MTYSMLPIRGGTGTYNTERKRGNNDRQRLRHSGGRTRNRNRTAGFGTETDRTADDRFAGLPANHPFRRLPDDVEWFEHTPSGGYGLYASGITMIPEPGTTRTGEICVRMTMSRILSAIRRRTDDNLAAEQHPVRRKRSTGGRRNGRRCRTGTMTTTRNGAKHSNDGNYTGKRPANSLR